MIKDAVQSSLRIPVAALLAALLFSCASSSGQAGFAPVNIPEDFAGIVHAGRTRTQKEYAYLHYLGAQWILRTFYWDSIEPEDGEWDFLEYDAFVEKAASEGIQVLGVLGLDTWWIHADRDTHRYIPPERIPDFLNFVRQTVSRYRGRVSAWCIWNEPNFIFWNGTDEEFFSLARQTADAVREADPDVLLLGGAFNRGVLGLPEKFIRGLFEAGAMKKVDAVAFHPYELNPRRTVKLYDQFRGIADAYGFGEKIWITEVGYPTGGWYPTKVTEKKFPAYLIKTFVLLAAGGARRIFWYQLFDPVNRNGGSSEDFFGLVRSKREYKSKGAEAFRLCATHLPGTVLEPKKIQREGINDSVQCFYFSGADGGVLVLWKDGIGTAKIRLRMPGSAHLRHDSFSGAALPVSSEIDVKVNNSPLFITWQGDTEEPCLLTKP